MEKALKLGMQLVRIGYRQGGNYTQPLSPSPKDPSIVRGFDKGQLVLPSQCGLGIIHRISPIMELNRVSESRTKSCESLYHKHTSPENTKSR